MATLTFAYADSTMAVGPLAQHPVPGSYDLCGQHCQTLTAPRGWELIRIPIDDEEPQVDVDDLVALAKAVREAGFGYIDTQQPLQIDEPGPMVEVKRKGHLTMLVDPTA